MAGSGTKQSYTIPCPTVFRDAVEALARRRGVNVADLARSVTLVVPPKTVAAFPDPGGPARGDRESVRVKSGTSEGRPWRRKPRLQARMAPGLDVATVRRALALALAIDRGDMEVRVDRREPAAPPPAVHDEVERLRAMVSVLSFEPLPGGVTSRSDALHVLGFPPGRTPDAQTLRARYRVLAIIHHPDGLTGSHERMSQLNAAMELLRRGA